MTRPLMVLCMFSVIIVVILAGYIHSHNAGVSQGIQKSGYDIDDVKTFCRYTDYRLEDFAESEGVRNQYNLWKEGKIKFVKRVARDGAFEGTYIIIDCDIEEEVSANEN